MRQVLCYRKIQMLVAPQSTHNTIGIHQQYGLDYVCFFICLSYYQSLGGKKTTKNRRKQQVAAAETQTDVSSCRKK